MSVRTIFSYGKIILWCGLLAKSSQTISQNLVQVDPLTGTASVTLPIQTINSGDLSLPISIFYSGGGVKVNEQNGSIGMGWNLQAGGSVTRELRGIPDDYTTPAKNGWLHGDIASQVSNFFIHGDQNYAQCSDEVTDGNQLDQFGYSTDTEPDIFSFNAPGLQGKFVFDKDKIIQTIPYQDLFIEVTRTGLDSLIGVIKITNNQGIKYTFASGTVISRRALQIKPSVDYFKTDYGQYEDEVVYNNSWNLTQIDSPTGGTIHLTYQQEFYYNDPIYSTVVNNSTGKIDSLYSLTDYVSGKLLQSITGANKSATFNWNGAVLGSITIQDQSYDQSVAYSFAYHAVRCATTPVQQAVYRYFLSEFTENVNCNTLAGYQFTYHGIDFTTKTTEMPFNSGVKQDLFGYYNGTATSLVPEIYSGGAGTDGELYRIAPATGYSLIAGGGGRQVNAAKVYYGSLETLTIPSGGQESIVYEPNDYYDSYTDQTLLGAGVRVKEITTTGGDPASNQIRKYRYTTSPTGSRSSGQWIYRPMLAFGDGLSIIRVPYNLAPDETILYSRSAVTTSGEGKTVFEFQNSAEYNTVSESDFSATLSRLGLPYSEECVSTGNLNAGYYTFPFAPNTNYSFERGQPIRISEYTVNGQLVQRKTYAYQRTTLPIKTFYGLRFEKFFNNDIYQYAKYKIFSNVDKRVLTETVQSFDQNDSTKYVSHTNTYAYSGHQMLSQITTTGSDNSEEKKSFMYVADYGQTGTDTQSLLIQSLASSHRQGMLIESVSERDAQVKDASLTLLGSFSSNRVLPSQFLKLGKASEFSPSTISGNAFNYASSCYYPSTIIDTYDDVGHPLVVRNRNRSIKSLIYGYNNSLPIATITNARTSEVIYYDFEPGRVTDMVINGTISNNEYWTGNSSLSMSSGGYLQQNNMVKGNCDYYRFSCYLKGASSTTLSAQIQVGGSTVTSSSISYTAPGTWHYIEGRIDMSALSTGATFSFKLSTPGSVYIDNVSLYPENARMEQHVYAPINGETAMIDTRGAGSYKIYNGLGRLQDVKNRDKDIVLVREYKDKTPTTLLPSSNFTSSLSPAAIFINSSVTYTAEQSCVGGVQYAWYVDGVVQASTSLSMVYQFTQNKDYQVRCVASSNGGSTDTEATVHPIPSFSIDANLATGENNQFNNCNNNDFRHITVTLSSGCYESGNITYYWYEIADGVTYSPTITTTNTYTVEFNYSTSFQVLCEVHSTCRNLTTGNYDPVIASQQMGFIYIMNPNDPC